MGSSRGTRVLDELTGPDRQQEEALTEWMRGREFPGEFSEDDTVGDSLKALEALYANTIPELRTELS